MESNATSLLLLSLVLSCLWLESLPGAEAQVFLPCKTSKDCEAIHCESGTAQCILSQCQCPNLSTKGLLKARETVLCKTSSDCKDVLHCLSSDPVCMDLECYCLGD